ncbi:MAG: SH3 domain-containing protein, partial [Bacteroidales bacterium]
MKYYIFLAFALLFVLGDACKPGAGQKKEEDTTSRDVPANPDIISPDPTPQEDPQPTEQNPTPIQDPPSNGEEDNLEHLRAASSEFNELSKAKNIKAWVTGLRVKAYPGDEYEHLATLKENETVEYLYHRTVRRSEYRFRGQKLEDNWYLVKTQAGVVGWVHGGGIKFIDDAGKEVAANARTAGEKSDADKVENDWTFVPGKRIGQVRYNTTEEGLVKLFGFDNI